MNTSVVRIANPQDIDAILGIENQVFSDPWSAESFTPDFTDPYTWFRVLEVDGVIAGYVIARIVARQGEIANIAVDPGHQRAGFGGTLLDAAVAATDSAMCEAVWLEVRMSNEPAQRLYASRGFEPIGRRKGYYRAPVEDALVLRRTNPTSGAAAEKR